LPQRSDFSEGSSGQVDHPLPKPPGRSAVGDADNDTSRPCIPVYLPSGFVSIGPADSDNCPKRDIPHSCLKSFRIEWVAHCDVFVQSFTAAVPTGQAHPAGLEAGLSCL
jgi:hypothetical protein